VRVCVTRHAHSLHMRFPSEDNETGLPDEDQLSMRDLTPKMPVVPQEWNRVNAGVEQDRKPVMLSKFLLFVIHRFEFIVFFTHSRSSML